MNNEFDQLLKLLYQGPLEEPLWGSFLNKLLIVFDCQYATLLLRPPRAGDEGVVLNATVPFENSYHSYRSDYFHQDPFVNLPIGEACILSEVVDKQELLSSSYYKDYLQPTDSEYLLGIDVEDKHGALTRLRLTRGKAANDFSQSDKLALNALVEHLVQAINLYDALAHAQAQVDVYQHAFDCMEVGCILLNEKFQVFSLNSVARKILTDDGFLRVKNKQLYLPKAQQLALVELLKQQIADYQPNQINGFQVVNQRSPAGMGLLIKTLEKSSTPDAGPVLAIYFADPARPKLGNSMLLEQLFSFTAAEAKTVLLLSNGLTLDEAAEQLGVRRSTVKTHLASAFAKTGTSRQANLVQLILHSVACLG